MDIENILLSSRQSLLSFDENIINSLSMCDNLVKALKGSHLTAQLLTRDNLAHIPSDLPISYVVFCFEFPSALLIDSKNKQILHFTTEVSKNMPCEVIKRYIDGLYPDYDTIVYSLSETCNQCYNNSLWKWIMWFLSIAKKLSHLDVSKIRDTLIQEQSDTAFIENLNTYCDFMVNTIYHEIPSHKYTDTKQSQLYSATFTHLSNLCKLYIQWCNELVDTHESQRTLEIYNNPLFGDEYNSHKKKVETSTKMFVATIQKINGSFDCNLRLRRINPVVLQQNINNIYICMKTHINYITQLYNLHFTNENSLDFMSKCVLKYKEDIEKISRVTLLLQNIVYLAYDMI